MTTETINKPVEVQTQVQTPEFSGRYAAQCLTFYSNLIKLFGVIPQKAEKIARMAASDAGAIVKNSSATFGVGTPNAHNRADISDAVKVKGATLTNALLTYRAVKWTFDAGKNGVSWGNTKWTFVQPIQDWIDAMKI